MNTHRTFLPVAFWVFAFLSHAEVITITKGSETGYTMTDGNTYVIQKSVSFTNSKLGGNGMSVAENATVVLYVPQGVTLTAKGKNGDYQHAGGAGILVPSTSTLVITGRGTINAEGGNAGKGHNGNNGYSGDSAGGSPSNPFAYACAGAGGRGGRGGGGAGAGIGGNGGTGAEGGNGGESYSTGWLSVSSTVTGVKNHGAAGSRGTAGTSMGTVVLLGTVTVSATGGSSSSSGTTGSPGAFSGYAGVPNYQGGELKGYGASGGGGGGGGVGGTSAKDIGGGGASGGSGSGGDNGNIYWGIPRIGYGDPDMVSAIPGDSGKNASSVGSRGGDGRLCKSKGATINSSRTFNSLETHAAAQYVISFDPNGGTVSSGGESAIATLGCELPNCPNPPERFGYRFKGWTTASGGGELYYSATGTKGVSSYSSPTPMTLFAQWEKLPWLTVYSPFDVCSPSVGVHPIESSTSTTAFCPATHVAGKLRFDCIGWHGTGDVLSSGVKTNVTFTIAHDSSLSWLWKTNVWIGCTIGGNATSKTVAGWYPINGGSVFVPFETQETKCVARMNGDTNGVSIDMASNTVIIPTDSPHELAVEIIEVINNGHFPLSWSDVDGESGWIVVEDPSADDGFCLKSGLIPAGATSSTTLDITGPGRLDFDWRISANRGDFAYVYVDGVQKSQITRETTWTPASLVIEGTGLHTVRWTYERRAATDANEDAAFLDNVTWRPMVSLSVASSEGVATPATGTAVYYWGDEIAASVVAPESGADERAVFTGWTGTGSVPAKGTASNVEFVITEDSSLTWNWQKEYLISLATEGSVETDFINEWVEAGTLVVVPYRLSTSYAEFGLDGDTDGVTIDTKTRTLIIPADHPRSIVLRTTATLTLAEALDGPGLVWSTDAGFEWTAQTTVTADCADATVSGPVNPATDASGIETTVTGSGTLRWRWKLVAAGTAGMDVIVDGNFANPVRMYATSGDWAVDSLVLNGDTNHVIRFEFWNTGVSFSDCAYLDMVSWTPVGEVRDRTITTPEPVPYVWLAETAADMLSGHGGDYEAAALATAANGVDKVWECYVAGISPTNAAERFEARIEIANGVPVVTWTPDLNVGGTKRERAYIVEGKANLTDASWGPTNAASRFFRVKVGMPE